MKKLLISMLAVATLASCAKEETLSFDKGEAVQFGNAFVDNATRANDYGPSNPLNPLTEFKLWGTVKGIEGPTAIFANDTVEGTVGADNVWNCTTKTQYWIEDATYNFAAVVGGTVTAPDGLPSSIEYTADGNTDLLYARSNEYTGLASDNPKVAFDFKHLLSKIKFTLENTTSNAANVGTYTYTLTDVKITNAITTGTYTVADTKNDADNSYTVKMTADAWTSKVANGMTFDSIVDVTNNTSKSSAAESLIIPMNGAKVSYTVNLYYGGKKITSTPGNATVNFAPGCAYNLVVSTGLNNEIKFSVTTDPSWTQVTPDTAI